MAFVDSGKAGLLDVLKTVEHGLNKSANKPLTNSAYEMQEAELYVYLFTVGKKALTTDHALTGRVEVPACKPGERYVRFHIPLPEPFPQRVEDVFGTGADPFVYHRGRSGARRIAQDICDPSNPTLNQSIRDYGNIDPYFAVQNGTDFAKHGVFWSLNNPPLEEEVERAEAARDAFLRRCINLHDQFSREDPKQLTTLMQSNGFDVKDVRIALEHFGEERPGFAKYVQHTECPNCGEKVKAGVAFHRDMDGDLCVIDWERTVAAGKKTREQVPPEKVWWGKFGRRKNGLESVEAE
jgi:hypothetical protein